LGGVFFFGPRRKDETKEGTRRKSEIIPKRGGNAAVAEACEEKGGNRNWRGGVIDDWLVLRERVRTRGEV